ncbi:GSCOCT00012635001.2-RA-CDS [Cotesia congregata]|uniref:Glutathione S-transferase Delta 6 n=1 Tax=Cotesia congregata TaxID=51543 RepID=A0A8J2HM88_COTCN|nr:GSCOCT00012635001.2-RA-CDS [Cotesia congregata]CAG5103423.1 glutathione S-transferase Delta 6 [Cotesia congregata]
MVILYSTDLSPPCRAVLMAARVINLNLDVRETSLLKNEHKTEQFLKLNPQHTIPTIDDDGFILWDSHAIIRYLVSKYAKDDFLYPKDLQKRAIIDQRLHFEGELLFVRLRNIVRPIFYKQTNKFNEELVNLVHEACEMLDKFLEGKKWLAGDNFTLADISCVSTVSSYPVLLSLDKYKNIVAWLNKCENEIPGYAEINVPGVTKFFKIMKSLTSS